MSIRRTVASVLATSVVIGCTVAVDTSGLTGEMLPDAAVSPPTSDAESDASSDADGGTTDAPVDAPSTGNENCENGIDDDGDGKVDCDDSDCTGAGYACRSIPDGWQGPFALYAGTASAPDCVAPYPTVGLEGNDGLVAAAPSCSCTCGALTGNSCTASLEFRSNTCGSNAGSTSVGATCVDVTSSASGVFSTAATGSNGSCTASAAAQSPPTWTRRVRACRAAGDLPAGGCAATARCAPPSPSPFARGQCISRDGDQACPSDYPKKNLEYRGVTDTRACVGCGCTPPSCSSPIRVFAGEDCTGQSATTTTSCSSSSISPVRSARLATTGTQCTVVNGTPQGSATGSQPFTVCCPE
jgi:hypothetical protein